MLSQGKSIPFWSKSAGNVYVSTVLAKENCRYCEESEGTLFAKAVRTLSLESFITPGFFMMAGTSDRQARRASAPSAFS